MGHVPVRTKAEPAASSFEVYAYSKHVASGVDLLGSFHFTCASSRASATKCLSCRLFYFVSFEGSSHGYWILQVASSAEAVEVASQAAGSAAVALGLSRVPSP